MKQQAHIVAQRLLNLYRQEHVINGGWAVINKVFIEETKDSEVLNKLKELPTGSNLVKHIENLKSGKTLMDSISPDLLPYGGLMEKQNKISASISQDDFIVLSNIIKKFEPNQQSLNDVVNSEVVKHFGDNWIETIQSILSSDKELASKWADIIKTYNAYNTWNKAQHIIHEEITDRSRAQIQADMPDYETYLPLFGEQGKDLLNKFRTIISALSQK